MSPLDIQCVVEEKEPLRMPGITRNYCKSNDMDVTVELPENVFSLDKGAKTKITIGIDKEVCLKEYDFCGVGYVVSKNRIETDKGALIRVVISIGGLLLILKTRNEDLLRDLNIVEKYYVGIKRIS